MLYPACAKKRSQIDQRLYFNIGTLYQRMGDCVYPVCFGKTKTIPQEKIDSLKEALMFTNQMVANGFVIGDTMTIADIDLMATFSTLEACGFMNLSPYKNLGEQDEATDSKICRELWDRSSWLWGLVQQEL